MNEYARQRRKQKIKFTIVSIISLCVFFTVWYICTAILHLKPDYILPSPVQVVQAFIEKLTQTTLRNIIGELELDQTLTSRDTINTKLRAVLDDATNKWGIKVNRVELQDITPPESVLQAMEKQMQAERNKRATILTSEGEKAAAILKSEGEKTAIINKAEADKQMAILNAEGEAQARIRKAEAEAIAIEKITEAVGKSTNPANYLLAQKYIQMLEEVATGDKTKTVYLPYEATNLMGSIGGIKDLFKSE